MAAVIICSDFGAPPKLSLRMMNLFAGKQWRCRYRYQTYGHSGGRRGWNELREQHWNIYTTIYKIDSQWEFATWFRELKPRTLWQPREMRWGGQWEGGSRGRWHMYTYGWFTLMYGRNLCNIVRQLPSNLKINEFKN